MDRQPTLCWLGLVGLADPIRPHMRELIASFHEAGLRTVMICRGSARNRLCGRQ